MALFTCSNAKLRGLVQPLKSCATSTFVFEQWHDLYLLKQMFEGCESRSFDSSEGLWMRLFRIKKKSSQIQREGFENAQFAEIQFEKTREKYQSNVLEIIFKWDSLKEKWDSKFASLDIFVKNEPKVGFFESVFIDPSKEILDDFRPVIADLLKIEKSIREDLRQLKKSTSKQGIKLLEKKISDWKTKILRNSDLRRWANLKIWWRKRKYYRKLNQLRYNKNQKEKIERKRVRAIELAEIRERQEQENQKLEFMKKQEEERLRCKTCSSTPSLRESMRSFAENYYKQQKWLVKGDRLKRKGEANLASGFKMLGKFGTASLMEMNLRQKAPLQFRLPDLCPECGMDWTPINYPPQS